MYIDSFSHMENNKTFRQYANDEDTHVFCHHRSFASFPFSLDQTRLSLTLLESLLDGILK